VLEPEETYQSLEEYENVLIQKSESAGFNIQNLKNS